MGLLLFMIFIIDLLSGIEQLTTILVADDTPFIFQGISLKRTMETPAKAENRILSDKLSVDESKREQRVFTLKSPIYAGGYINTVKFLGVHVDSKYQQLKHAEGFFNFVDFFGCLPELRCIETVWNVGDLC